MINYDDIIGQTFGRLIVLEYCGHFVKSGTKSKRHYYRCQCNCDNNTIILVDRYKLLSGHSTSCGCKAKDVIKQRNKNDNPSKYYKKKQNEYYIDDFGIVHIKMSNTNNEMLCDLECADYILQYYWHERNGYARSSINNVKIYAHRVIMNAGKYNDNNPVDHINGNTLDNRKSNLRIVTIRENILNTSKRKDNTSGVTGVCWDKAKEKWMARIHDNGKDIFLGYFTDINEAITVRQNAENQYYGEYSYNNSREQTKLFKGCKDEN